MDPILFLLAGIFLLILIILIAEMITFVPKDKVAMYYDIVSGAHVVLQPGRHFSLSSLFYRKWLNRFQDTVTNLIDIRAYADPINNYQILTESQLVLGITGKAIVRIADPVRAWSSTNSLDDTVDALCKAELRNYFSNLSAKKIIQKQDEIEVALTATLNEDLKEYGTTIDKFIVSHIELPRPLIETIELTTAKEAEHKCKLLEIDNQRKLAEETIKIQALRHDARMRNTRNQIGMRTFDNQQKVKFLEELRSKGVDLTEYLKFQEYKKAGATLIVGGSSDKTHVHVGTDDRKTD